MGITLTTAAVVLKGGTLSAVLTSLLRQRLFYQLQLNQKKLLAMCKGLDLGRPA